MTWQSSTTRLNWDRDALSYAVHFPLELVPFDADGKVELYNKRLSASLLGRLFTDETVDWNLNEVGDDGKLDESVSLGCCPLPLVFTAVRFASGTRAA
jgi:hypothetical protein